MQTNRLPIYLCSVATVLALVMVLSGCASRTVAPQTVAPATVQDVPNEVAAVFRKSIGAWNAGDLDGFLQLYADTATLAQREGFLVGKTVIRMLYEPRFATGAQRDTLAMERIDVEELAPDLALVRGVYKITGTKGNPVRATTTMVMRRIQGRWQVIHDHST